MGQPGRVARASGGGSGSGNTADNLRDASLGALAYPEIRIGDAESGAAATAFGAITSVVLARPGMLVLCEVTLLASV
jgi:hypothetical protein